MWNSPIVNWSKNNIFRTSAWFCMYLIFDIRTLIKSFFIKDKKKRKEDMHHILFMVGDTVFAFNPSALLYETPTHIWKLLKISISVFEVTFYAIQSFLRKHYLPVVFLMTVISFLFAFPSVGKSLVIDNVLYDLLKLFVVHIPYCFKVRPFHFCFH